MVGTRAWYRKFDQAGGSNTTPWFGPGDSYVQSRINQYPTSQPTVSRVLLDLCFQITVPAAEDPPSPQWLFRFGVAFSVTVGGDPAEDPHLIFNTPDPSAILTGVLQPVAYHGEDTTKSSSLRLQNMVILESKGQRRSPVLDHGPVVSLNVTPIDLDGFTSPIVEPFEWTCWSYMRVMYTNVP